MSGVVLCVEVGFATKSATVFEAIAKPMPTLPASPPLAAPALAICEFTPITLPCSSSSAPPELPGLIAASVWSAPSIGVPSGAWISRSSADTIPLVNVWSRP